MVINRLQVLPAPSPTRYIDAVPSCYQVVKYFECCHLDSVWTVKMHLLTVTTKQTAPLPTERCVSVSALEVQTCYLYGKLFCQSC